MTTPANPANYKTLLQEAFVQVKQMRAQMEAMERSNKAPIAIVGMSCRFPGGDSPDDFWNLLRTGGDAVREVPRERWDVDAFYDPNPEAPGKMSTRWGGFLTGVDLFDAGFFGISPREAERMDPQQRLFLAVAWEALEAAGQTMDRLTGSATGVFAGVCNSDYPRLQFTELDRINAYSAAGGAHSIMTGRLSYFLDLRGPSLAVDTACSSSLVAVHYACQSLRSRECSLAVAGGVNLVLLPHASISLSKAGMMAPDGRCKTFDAQANGYVRGEGCGVVILKRLSDALADGDPILALIRGTAVNQDGRTVGMTAPNLLSQQAVIRAALDNAGVEASQIGYIEAHGTGTSLGDPIEVEALTAVVGRPRASGQSCAIGSVKTNIGHLEGAAGIAGLIKVVLSLQREAIPPHLHFKQLNPNISLNGTPFVIPTQLRPWPAGLERRCAGVSSFGFSGTNAHVILEEAPPQADEASTAERVTARQTALAAVHLLPLSARSPEALRSLAQAYREWLPGAHRAPLQYSVPLTDICYTAAVRRSHHSHRLALVASTGQEMAERLESFLQEKTMPGVSAGSATPGERPGLVFVFSGQGPQWAGMGLQLLEAEPVFRAKIEECDRFLRRHAGWSLVEHLTAGESQSRLDDTEFAQPALLGLQVSLAALWRSWGIEPDFVVGHSLGEIAAAHTAGILSLEDAIRVSVERGRLMQPAKGQGKMVSVELPPEEAQHRISGREALLAIAAINSPASAVLSGDTAALEAVVEKLQSEGIFCRWLPVNYAFHSPQMHAFAQELVRSLEWLEPQTEGIRLVSTVTGRFSRGREWDAAYWGRNLREPVRFAAAAGALVDEGAGVFLEISPHPALHHAIADCLSRKGTTGAVLPSLRRGQGERAVMLQSLGALYTLGKRVAWDQAAPKGRCVMLPSYRWQGQRYWLEELKPKPQPAERAAIDRAYSATHPWLGQPQRSPVHREIVFQSRWSPDAPALLEEHRIYDTVVVAGASFVSVVLSAAKEAFGEDSFFLEDMSFSQALVLPHGGSRAVQVILTPQDSGRLAFQFFSTAGDPSLVEPTWTLHVNGTLRVRPASAEGLELQRGRSQTAPTVASPQSQTQGGEELAGPEFYQTLRAREIQLGPRFQWIEQIWRKDGEAICRMRLPQEADEAAQFVLHPGLIDSCFQLLAAALPPGAVESGAYVPFALEGFRFLRRPESGLWCHALIRHNEASSDWSAGDVSLFDESGEAVAEVVGLHFKRAPREALLRSVEAAGSNWLYQVQWTPLEALEKPGGAAYDRASRGHWIVFSDREGFAAQLTKLLQENGQTCTLVFPGESYQALDGNRFRINPAEPEDVRRVFQETGEQTLSRCQRIIHCWSLDVSSPEKMKQAQASSAGSMLSLVQALAAGGWPEPPRLWVVTRGAQAVSDEVIAVAQAPVWGLGRVVAVEHPEIWGGLVDLDAVASEDEAAALLAEVWMPRGEEHIAFRGGRRYAARLAPCAGSADSTGATRGHRPRQQWSGSYLITGGLGDLGLKVAGWMVEQGARHLALAGRSAPSEAAREALTNLENAGARVLVVQADVTCEEQVAGMLAEIGEAMPPLRGIVHAAGVLDDGVLLQQTWTRFESVMAPKTEGAWNLHALTQKMPLDFFVLFSSAASLLGSPGQGNYAAGNAFLDALAHYRRGQGLAALSINWGPWSEIGVAAALGRGGERRWSNWGLRTISPDRGLQALQDAMSQDGAQVGVLSVNWPKFMEQFAGRKKPALFAGLALQASPSAGAGESQPKQPDLPRQLADAPASQHMEILAAHIRAQAIRVLGLDASHPLNPRQPLNELGLDSLMAGDLRNALAVAIQRPLPATLLFNYPTLEALSNYLGQVLSLGAPAGPAADSAKETELTKTAAKIEQLSDDEAATLLAEKLAAMSRSTQGK